MEFSPSPFLYNGEFFFFPFFYYMFVWILYFFICHLIVRKPSSVPFKNCFFFKGKNAGGPEAQKKKKIVQVLFKLNARVSRRAVRVIHPTLPYRVSLPPLFKFPLCRLGGKGMPHEKIKIGHWSNISHEN